MKAPTVSALKKAIENRDAKNLRSLYADDAVITIIDSDNPPSKPRVIKGSVEIGAFLEDVYSRDMTHTVESGVLEGNRLAFIQGCKYGDGGRVIASSIAEIGPRGIVKQTTVQAWDS